MISKIKGLMLFFAQVSLSWISITLFLLEVCEVYVVCGSMCVNVCMCVNVSICVYMGMGVMYIWAPVKARD